MQSTQRALAYLLLVAGIAVAVGWGAPAPQDKRLPNKYPTWNILRTKLGTDFRPVSEKGELTKFHAPLIDRFIYASLAKPLPPRTGAM